MEENWNAAESASLYLNRRLWCSSRRLPHPSACKQNDGGPLYGAHPKVVGRERNFSLVQFMACVEKEELGGATFSYSLSRQVTSCVVFCCFLFKSSLLMIDLGLENWMKNWQQFFFDWDNWSKHFFPSRFIEGGSPRCSKTSLNEAMESRRFFRFAAKKVMHVDLHSSTLTLLLSGRLVEYPSTWDSLFSWYSKQKTNGWNLRITPLKKEHHLYQTIFFIGFQTCEFSVFFKATPPFPLVKFFGSPKITTDRCQSNLRWWWMWRDHLLTKRLSSLINQTLRFEKGRVRLGLEFGWSTVFCGFGWSNSRCKLSVKRGVEFTPCFWKWRNGNHLNTVLGRLEDCIL